MVLLHTNSDMEKILLDNFTYIISVLSVHSDEREICKGFTRCEKDNANCQRFLIRFLSYKDNDSLASALFTINYQDGTKAMFLTNHLNEFYEPIIWTDKQKLKCAVMHTSFCPPPEMKIYYQHKEIPVKELPDSTAKVHISLPQMRPKIECCTELLDHCEPAYDVNTPYRIYLSHVLMIVINRQAPSYWDIVVCKSIWNDHHTVAVYREKAVCYTSKAKSVQSRSVVWLTSVCVITIWYNIYYL